MASVTDLENLVKASFSSFVVLLKVVGTTENQLVAADDSSSKRVLFLVALVALATVFVVAVVAFRKGSLIQEDGKESVKERNLEEGTSAVLSATLLVILEREERENQEEVGVEVGVAGVLAVVFVDKA